jgi:hypothetical protein
VSHPELPDRTYVVRFDEDVFLIPELGFDLIVDGHQRVVDVLAPVLAANEPHGGAPLERRERLGAVDHPTRAAGGFALKIGLDFSQINLVWRGLRVSPPAGNNSTGGHPRQSENIPTRTSEHDLPPDMLTTVTGRISDKEIQFNRVGVVYTPCRAHRTLDRPCRLRCSLKNTHPESAEFAE